MKLRRGNGAASPLFLRIFLLMLVCVGVVQLLNFALIIAIQPPTSRVYTVQQIERAIRDGQGRSLMLYLPQPGMKVRVRLTDVLGPTLDAWWYDLRTGKAEPLFRRREHMGYLEVTSPAEGPDSVLVIDAASARLPVPGQAAFRGR